MGRPKIIQPEYPAAATGRRARKKEETRQRIMDAAMALFIAQGFVATTIDDIAEAADISKRSFFDYFPSKEDVVQGWQDAFEADLIEAVAARPASEPLSIAAERALVAAVERFDLDDMRLHERLRAEAPALAGRDHLKYARLEQAFAQALLKRSKGKTDDLAANLVAMVAVGAMRVASAHYHAHGHTEAPTAAVRRIIKSVRTEWAAPKKRTRTSKRSS